MRFLVRLPLLAAAVLAPGLAPAVDPPRFRPDEVVIRGRAGPSDVVVTATARVAGAIHSLTWNGKEFVDSTDHGRQIQSASNLDCGLPTMPPEVFNPTEAGSRADGAGRTTTSRLLAVGAKGNELRTVTRMAFWLRPGETSGGHPARNTTPLSDHLVSKHVRVGYKGLAHAIEYAVTFTLPKGERHTLAQFEAVTGYMPPEFGTFLRFDRGEKRLKPLSDGPGEQADPVVLSTADGRYAMGVFSPDQPSPGYPAAGYGRFRFAVERVVKWNCVFRVRAAAGLAAGEYTYRCFLVVGTRKNCEDTLAGLYAEFGK
jgi:hypothetical protein